MQRAILVTLSVLCLAGTVRADNRLFDTSRTGYDVSLARDAGAHTRSWETAGGFSWRGRVGATLAWAENDGTGRDVLAGTLEVAFLRVRGFGAEIGLSRVWRRQGRKDIDQIPLRLFQRLDLGWKMRLIPYAAVTRIRGRDHDNERGDLGLDLLWTDRLRLACEWNLNADLRDHALTFRIGYVGRF